MEELVQCVPNFSEGRDRATLEAIVAAARTVAEVRVADWSGDPDHHRMVLTLVGPAAATRDAALAAAAEAVRRIDLTQHSGQHPRLGARRRLASRPRPGSATPLARARAGLHYRHRAGPRAAVPGPGARSRRGAPLGRPDQRHGADWGPAVDRSP